MILTCPECSTNYLSDPESIGPNGRTVRCSKCKATWFVSAEEAQESLADRRALEEDLTPRSQGTELGDSDEDSSQHHSQPMTKGADALLRDKADADKMARRRKVIVAIWAIPLLILLAGAILAYAYRQEIVIRHAKAATIYKAFGITVKTAGLEIEQPTARTAMIDGQAVLVVNSSIRNVSSKNQGVPLLQLSLHNSAGEELAAWYVEPEKSYLRPKDRLAFVTQYPDPPVDAVSLRYDFTDD